MTIKDLTLKGWFPVIVIVVIFSILLVIMARFAPQPEPLNIQRLRRIEAICIDGVEYLLGTPPVYALSAKFNTDSTVVLCDYEETYELYR